MKYIYTQKNKLFAGITGAALVILGVLCICNPWGMLQSVAWVIGLLVMISGVSTFLFWLINKPVIPAASPVLSTALVQMLLGLLLLNSRFLSAILVVVLGILVTVVGAAVLLSLFVPMIIKKRYQNTAWDQDDSIDEQ